MRKLLSLLFLLSGSVTFLSAQGDTESTQPYYQIPEYPEEYTPQTIIARTIDGLGYRYFWATEGLRQQDLDFNPGNEGRPASDVLTHLLGLSDMIRNVVEGKPNVRPKPEINLTWEEQREATLDNLKTASDLLKSENPPFTNEMKITFQRGDKTSDFPLWILLNGPLADAIYHTGQIASFRRSSGNPVNPGMNVFIGKTKE